MNENTKNDCGPAFPTGNERQTGPNSYHYEGMTLRDYFAAKAMQGAIASSSDKLDFGPDIGAAWAYQVADAMIAARGEMK